MKTIEEIKKQMVLGATSVEEHREAPTAQAVTQFRQTLLTDVKKHPAISGVFRQ